MYDWIHMYAKYYGSLRIRDDCVLTTQGLYKNYEDND